MKQFTLSAALLLMTFIASAHAIWIETASKGNKNKTHQVRVFLGEYADNERDSVRNWFSNMKEAELYITDPSGNKQKIALRDAGNYLAGEFTPATEGSYTLSIAHTVADIYNEGKIEYYATASVNVGKAGNEMLSKSTFLAVQPPVEAGKVASPLHLQVYMEGAPVAKAKVLVISPDGWERTLYSDEQGKVSCATIQPGMHMLEVVKVLKTPGTHNGKSFKQVTHMVTHCIQVNK
ncbi:MAG: DUF4198 domain-containing protein [Pseudobacter sp.]|uniref:DUF4198 domain-containing protein n=1 Tax=Pseudobacter sp. TaxID=2045420 RepID=UPI003F7CDCE7